MGCPVLYHAMIGLPAGLRLPDQPVLLAYSNHARRAASADRYGDVGRRLPRVLQVANAQVVEVEADGDRLLKVVYRLQLDDRLDLCLVVCPPWHPALTEWTVKTVWLNEHADQHRTLDRRRYERPPAGSAGSAGSEGPRGH